MMHPGGAVGEAVRRIAGISPALYLLMNACQQSWPRCLSCVVPLMCSSDTISIAGIIIMCA